MATEQPSLLFSLFADKGRLQVETEIKAQLLIPVKSITSVLVFTDRPFRQSREITLERFLGIENLFINEDPPNVVFSFDSTKKDDSDRNLSQHLLVDVIEHPNIIGKKKKKYVVFKIERLTGSQPYPKKSKLKDIRLFIDSVTDNSIVLT